MISMNEASKSDVSFCCVPYHVNAGKYSENEGAGQTLPPHCIAFAGLSGGVGKGTRFARGLLNGSHPLGYCTGLCSY